MSAVRSKSLRLSLSPCRRQRRDVSVTGICDQRRASCFDDRRSSIPPKVVIRTTHICFSRAVATVHVILLSYLNLVIRSFFFGKEFFACQIGRSFQWRNSGETPCALEVRLAVGCTRYRTLGCSLRFGGLDLTSHRGCHVPNNDDQ